MANVTNMSAYAAHDLRPGPFARLLEALADRREYLRTLEELNALNDRELSDIGVSRLNVREVARAAVYG